MTRCYDFAVELTDFHGHAIISIFATQEQALQAVDAVADGYDLDGRHWLDARYLGPRRRK